MPGFIQIIEFTTSRPDEIKALSDEYRETRIAANDGTPPAKGTIVADRDRPNTYLNIVEFASYEDAMKNSNDPRTSEFAEKMMKLCDGPPKFYNTDVIESWDNPNT